MSIPKLERAGGDDGRQPPGLERLLDLDPLLPRQRAVMGPNQLLAGQLVELVGQPLGQAARVAEDDRGVVLANELEDSRVDRRPDAVARLRVRIGRRPIRRALRAKPPPAGSCPRSGRARTARAACANRRRRSGRRGSPPPCPDRLPPGSGRSSRPAAAWPRGRSAAAAAQRATPVAPGERARWAPRLVPARAWTSSRITCSTPRRISAAWLVRIKYSDSGVVIRMSGGLRTRWRRSSAGVSPVRTPTSIRGAGSPSRSAARPIPASGARRFRSTS